MNNKEQQKTGRIVALVIAGSALVTLFAPYIVAGLGLGIRYEFLIYLLALAGMLWSLIVAIKLWQAR